VLNVAFAFTHTQPTHTLSSRPKHHVFASVMRSGETPVLALAVALTFALPQLTQTLSSRPERHAFVFVTRSGETPVLAFAVALAFAFALALALALALPTNPSSVISTEASRLCLCDA
jgi:hypothetical protein